MKKVKKLFAKVPSTPVAKEPIQKAQDDAKGAKLTLSHCR